MFIWLIGLIVTVALACYHRQSVHRFTLAITGLFAAYLLINGLTAANQLLWLLMLLILIPLNIKPLRTALISSHFFNWMKKSLPPLSQTEQEAIEAGSPWWDAELFSGNPNWRRLHDLPPAKLTMDEQAFLDGPVETLCAMLNDWDITHRHMDLPKDVWDFIKTHKFFGMIIPKHYGGLEFSETAHSEVVMKISSRSSTAAVTVMVPNSLGPAKLLLAYGTDEQKNHFLPRLAAGEEIPAFALTGPTAGSDASAMPDHGVVCYDRVDGNKTLGIRLNWEKRYITLGPVATVLGLAFKLYDPEHLIGNREDIGITLALIPTQTKGVAIGRRHFPLNSGFQNGPNWGKDVFIPISWVIGGIEQVGNGWQMLMQCLATGRAISLPALSVGGAKFTSRNTGAYARIRKQFNIAIGEFEGVQEALARIAGETYLVDAARKVTCAALDQGEKPSVISAILKYELTERMRKVINDGMDIQGGSGICLGPRNYLGRLYQVIPIGITVEGANILTRTMMIFGQGAIRCHPYIQKEMAILAQKDNGRALHDFDSVLFEHIGHILHNLTAGFWHALTFGRFMSAPGDNVTRNYYRTITRFSKHLSLLADYALLTLAGGLKRKERLSGQFADVLSNLYLCSCALKHSENSGRLPEEEPLLLWACQSTLFQCQQALQNILRLLPWPTLSRLLKLWIFPFGAPCPPPSNHLIPQLANLLQSDTPARTRLTEGIYINRSPEDPTGRIELAFEAVVGTAPIQTKIRNAQKQQLLNRGDPMLLARDAYNLQIIDQQELDAISKAYALLLAAIAVDDFSVDELMGKAP